MRDIPSLTGLRGVAALWVMAFHVCKVAGEDHAPWALHAGVVGFGWTGVDLFFALSGFILMWTHGAHFAHPTKHALARFAAGRIVRVYPLSLVVLSLIALLTLADPSFVAWYKVRDIENFSLQAFLRTALLATRWGTGAGGDWNEPTWSLSAEMVGYAAFPALAWALTRCSAPTATVIGALSLALLAGFEIVTGLADSNPIDQVPALMRMGCGFIAGMAACRVRQCRGEHDARFASICGLLAVLAISLACRIKLGALFAPAGFVVLIACLSLRTGVLNALLSSRPALFLGRISFPLYLIHLTPLLWLASHVRMGALAPLNAAGLIAGYGAFCGLGAWGLHRVVERPLHHWTRRGFPLGGDRHAIAQAA